MFCYCFGQFALCSLEITYAKNSVLHEAACVKADFDIMRTSTITFSSFDSKFIFK